MGWTVGGGVEYALAPAWSVAPEHKYFDFGGSERFITAAPGGLASVNLAPDSTTLQTVSLGVNYKLGAGPGWMK